MRLASAWSYGRWVIGVVNAHQGSVTVLDPGAGSVDDVVRAGPAALAAIWRAASKKPSRPLGEVRLGPPLRRFNRDVLCTGWNYLDHFYESLGKREGQDPVGLPEHPTFFTKGPDTVIGPRDPIAFDAELSSKWDYEAELALVIGTDGRSIAEKNALRHVFGYFIANDVSQRDLQRAHGGQWLKGKSIDCTMPIGPWITVSEAVEDPANLLVECELNGQLVQQASTAEMAFPVERLISELSRGMTLRAGDVVLTGTPSGIGNAREPAIYLKENDVLVTRVTGLGRLENVVKQVPLV